MIWKVPKDWAGETVFILGGGPSLRGFDAEVLRGKGRIIATNEAGLAGVAGAEDEKPHAPWADVLYWADKRWFNWNRDRLGEHTGRYKIARLAPEPPSEQDIKVLPQGGAPLSDDPSRLAGFCSGGASINLAYLFGASRIVLLGFDMRADGRGDNWHCRHKQGTDKSRYVTHFMPPIAAMAWPLKQRGVEVINCTPGSALSCFPILPLEDLLMEKRTTPDAEAISVDMDMPAGLVPVIEEDDSLHLCPPQALERTIAALARHQSLRVRLRLRGGDVVTRRPAEWWRLKLATGFQEVVIESQSPNEAVLLCRKT